MRVLVIGGTGSISTHATAALLATGHEVTLLNRGGVAGPAGVTCFVGDRGDPAVLAHAVALARPEAVVDFVCFSPADAQVLAELAAGRIEHLIFVSTVDAFGFPQPVPISEAAARRPGIGAYAQNKQACEDLLLARPDLNVTVARPTYSMSDRFVISLFNHRSVGLMQRLRRGLPVVLPNGGEILIHPSDARDTGRMIAAMVGQQRAFGRTYTAGSRGVAMPQWEYIDLVAWVAGRQQVPVSIPLEAIDAMALASAANTVFSNVTRFDLDFAFDQFSADFPDFQWQSDLATPIRAYLARIEAEGLLDGPLVEDLETEILERWEATANA